MTFKQFLDDNRPALETHILTYLAQEKLNDIHLPYLQELIKKMSTFVLKGKLLRGLFIMLAYEICSNKKSSPNILDAATGIEITHSALLIHDDIMDSDFKRRGQSTIFAQYKDTAESSSYPNPLFYGQAMGICAGDIGFFLGYDLFARSSAKAETLNKIFTLYAKELYSVVNAQMADVHYSLTSEEPSTDTILNIYRYKTGRYTFALPFMIGGLQAGCNEKLLSQLSEAGERMGIVFQMIDDMIGLLGKEEDIGKPVGSDIRENKKTLIRKLLFEKANSSDKAKLTTLFGNKSITTEDITYIKNLITMHKINAAIMEEAHSLTNQAQDIIKEMDISDTGKNILLELSQYNISRAV